MVKKNKTAAIIQARFNSTRLRGKVLKKINGITILEILIKRLKKVKNLDDVIVACSNNIDDVKIISLCKKLRINYFVGSEKNVLKRYLEAAKYYNISNIVRITSDCPLMDPKVVGEIVQKFHKLNVDYASNIIKPTYPDGFDVEVMKFRTLQKSYLKKLNDNEKEHVTLEILNNTKYKKYSHELSKDYSKLRLTLDTMSDLKIINKLFKKYKFDFKISLNKILYLYKNNMGFFEKNSNYDRNDSVILNTGQKYWQKAKKIIPGGTMLFSKNPDLHLPLKWPAYFKKAKGCKIWDLDNKKYDDLFLMGVGTNILGYSHQSLEKNIKRVINDGNMSSLNSVDEIILAERLIDLHPWSEMVRFSRTGGEANSIAIRIARASSGKDNIAVCGYHGWHDWYLSSNIQNPNNLNNHLMTNLKINGTPKKLKNTVFTFEYNDFNELKRLVKSKNIGTIKMEVERDEKPKNNFLKKVRELATKNNIVLIFDECTSGFRSNLGGIHLKYKVIPDIAIFGKALGNGYAINAIIGKRSVMEAANKSFISSTFWTERIGSVAAIETLRIMKSLNSWTIISNAGRDIKKKWNIISKENKLKIDIKGLDALPKFTFNSKKNNLYKTFITQEMLKRNILASNVVYTCISHNRNILDKYYNVMNNVFKTIKKCENEEDNIFEHLESPESMIGLRSKK
jgi:glutamate-1-semialdehyde 2,1-aminomutase